VLIGKLVVVNAVDTPARELAKVRIVETCFIVCDNSSRVVIEKAYDGIL